MNESLFSNELDAITQRNVDSWLNGNYGLEIKQSIQTLLKDDPQQIIDAFFTHLSFGTGGMRGVMGIGTNRMNIYTVRAAAQGLANYILKQRTLEEKQGVYIGYDSRHFSRLFAEETAKVIAGNGIQAYLCDDIRPTPLISYGCRYKGCMAAVMITASHNPPEYNGFKVYWSDGAQVLPPHDHAIIHEVYNIMDPNQVKTVPSLNDPLIMQVGSEIDRSYLKEISSLQYYPEDNQKYGDELKIIYTSLHGVGIKVVPEALNSWGFTQIKYVKAQITPDGSFPTVKNPNPEDPAALQMGIKDLLQAEADLLIATDPDADRMGIAVRHNGQAVLLTGHQLSAIFLEHICEALIKKNSLPKNAAFIKTIGTTELLQAIGDHYGCACVNVLNGFKYIAEKIRIWEQSTTGFKYIFGCEESLGYLFGTFVRDKDATLSSCMISELALQAKMHKQTLVDKLYELYFKYGIYQEKAVSLNFKESKEGKAQMKLRMETLRKCKINSLADIPVAFVEDYQSLTRLNKRTGKTDVMELPKSDVLLFWLEDGSKAIIRPSGTEPKIKLSSGVIEKNFNNVSDGIAKCLERCDLLLGALAKIML